MTLNEKTDQSGNVDPVTHVLRKQRATPWDEPEGPPQFGLRALMLFQAGFALFLVLLMAVGTWAILPVFVATILLRVGPLRLKNPAWRRLTFDLLAGVALPVLCLWYDPIFFVGEGKLQRAAYLFMGFQIVSFLGWKIWHTCTGQPNSVASGFLMTGALFAFVVGVLLAPFSLIGLVIFGLGLLGLTPFLTAFALGSNAVAAFGPWFEDQQGRWRRILGFGLGIALALGLPMAVYFMFGDVLDQWLSQVRFPGRLLGPGLDD